jgi:GntR family transcriptional regulator
VAAPRIGRLSPQRARDALEVEESAAAELLHVGPVLAPNRIASVPHLPEGTPMYERRRRTVSEFGPVDLVSTFAILPASPHEIEDTYPLR